MEEPDYPYVFGDEPTVLRSWLDHHRQVLRWKAHGLSDEQLRQRLEPSTMTLGGMLKHLAFVENYWASVVLAGDRTEPWASVDWAADGDWDWHSAVDDTAEDLLTLHEQEVARADALYDRFVPGGLDQVAATSRRDGTRVTLRWILVHLVEEYARHNGHADLIRESIDGQRSA